MALLHRLSVAEVYDPLHESALQLSQHVPLVAHRPEIILTMAAHLNYFNRFNEALQMEPTK
ncbi:MAG TPA: hypothetical protein VFQ41_03950 [Candidatus Angelobacter sp.]|nr:hypothetical protein [Candidatus Angelobacter sp.]